MVHDTTQRTSAQCLHTVHYNPILKLKKQEASFLILCLSESGNLERMHWTAKDSPP
jgi:hypothetical protein